MLLLLRTIFLFYTICDLFWYLVHCTAGGRRRLCQDRTVKSGCADGVQQSLWECAPPKKQKKESAPPPNVAAPEYLPPSPTVAVFQSPHAPCVIFSVQNVLSSKTRRQINANGPNVSLENCFAFLSKQKAILFFPFRSLVRPTGFILAEQPWAWDSITSPCWATTLVNIWLNEKNAT